MAEAEGSSGQPKAAFIGLGQMGTPMARRLLGAGVPLAVFDLDRARCETLEGKGAVAAASPAEAAGGADAVITMLPGSQEVEAVVLGEGGVLAAMGEGAVLLDMSSSHPVETRKLGEAVRAAGRALVDAPVSGGVKRAKDGSLSIMAGGEAADIDRVEPLLLAMGSTVFRTGPLGSGHAAKALNNLLSASGLLAAAEVLLIGQRFGLAPGTLLEVLNASTGMNNSTRLKYPTAILSRRFDTGFALDLMLKDVSIALDLAKETETPAPSSALTRELAAAARSLLGPGRDHTEAVRLLETLAGEELEGEAG